VTDSSPTMQRRRLGGALRSLRESRGLTGDQVGAAVERSASWISRVEGGRLGLRARDLRDLLDLYDVTDPQRREELLRLAEAGRERTWLSEYRSSIPESYATFIGLEAEAATLQEYCTLIVPGLLQTEAYARVVISGGNYTTLSPRVIDDRVAVRMKRQRVLTGENPLKFSAIMSEIALQRTVGGNAVMKEQLEHLLKMLTRPNISLRVILNERLGYTAVASVALFRFSTDDPDVVYVENPAGGSFEEGERLSIYHNLFAELDETTLSENETSEYINKKILKLGD
jgi:transcriptional regulator with XRE-family HTH domain